MQNTVDLPIEVARVVHFEREEGSKGLGAVLLRVGPLSLWCKIFLDPKGEPFLSMPARKGKDDRYFQSAYFSDRQHHEQAQAIALEAFKQALTSPN